MGRSKTNCVYQEVDGTYEVDARYKHERIRKRGFASYDEATDHLVSERHRIQQSMLTGVRPVITLDAAAAKYIEWKEAKLSLDTDICLLDPLIERHGSLTLPDICDETLKPFVLERKAEGVKNKTINGALAIVRHMCNLAATEWRLPNGMTWLAAAPKITMLDLDDQRPPRPLSWREQREQLIPELPAHLVAMALFDLNTGVRENVVCNLSWAWEARVKLRRGLDVSVFVVPREFVKGRKRERILVCNSAAQAIIESQRGLHPERVFTYARPVRKGSRQYAVHCPVECMNNTAWQNARERAGLADVRIHDLRHTVGLRLRAAGVGERTQDEILWHSGQNSMTNHYAVAQVREIYDALELIINPSEEGESTNLLALIRQTQLLSQRKHLPQNYPSKRKAA